MTNFVLIPVRANKTSVFFIFGVGWVFFNNDAMVMQMYVLNNLVILLSLLLCSIVGLLPAGDAVGDSEC